MTTAILPFVLPHCQIDHVRTFDTTVVVEAHTVLPTMTCPDCSYQSARCHSRYRRFLHDLPSGEQSVRLLLTVRRFFCDGPDCPRRTFAERLPEPAPVRAQRTPRLTRALSDIGFATGGQAGARLSHSVRIGARGDTLLRIMRATTPPHLPPPKIVGVDDFALRKGRVYGTIVLDLEQHRPIDVLPDRTAATRAVWLRAHPGIEVISRDRALDYARGATDGAPHAIQVADRFHLHCNLREAVERAMVRLQKTFHRELSLAGTQQTAGAHVVEQRLPQPRYARAPARQQFQTARAAQRAQRYQEIQKRAAQGQSIRQIAHACAVSTKTISRWLHAGRLPPERRGYRARGKIDPYVSFLQARLAEGCMNQSQLWREIREQGVTGTRSLVGKWVRAQSGYTVLAASVTKVALPSAKQFSWLLMHTPEERTAEEQRVWKQLEQHATVVEINDLVQQFRTMFRGRQAMHLDTWLAGCQASTVPELRSFASVLGRDYAAVKASLTVPWSQGPVEGHFHRVKLIKRIGYGRANFDVLRKRVLYAA